MSVHRGDERGPVVVVRQWSHMHGPELWFPYAGPRGMRASQRRETALRGAISVMTGTPLSPDVVVERVCVRERAGWVDA